MERRAFILGSMAFMLALQNCSTQTAEISTNSNKSSSDTKSIFKELGTCSRTFFFILDREFGHSLESEERASELLAGGPLKRGHQCGMIWGASLAVGAESFRRNDDYGQAVSKTIMTTQRLMDSFSKTAKCVNCREITNCDLTTTFGLLKLILFKKQICLDLSEKWAPEAIQIATKGLSDNLIELPLHSKSCLSCASEVVKKMGASDKEALMVSGFAGGLGLSGNACGALSAALWMKNLIWYRKQSDHKPDTTKLAKAFDSATGSKMSCRKISGQHFKTTSDHTEYLRNGGCEKLINVLAQS
jgi:hypothetical protein